ncbi:MAG: peptidoglycan-associated lipoprotein Pal [Pseudomonadota bacterium]|nr:peptidoglycan-associated lipoprotein Pal [Pseudomonadota bacterium]
MCREGVVRAICVAGIAMLAAFAAGCSKKPPQELGSVGAEGPVTPGSARDFAVSVGDKVYFEVDSASLTPQAQTTLQGQARWLARYPNYTVTIEGHADERGTREYNIALGAKRATAVKNYLAGLGVPSVRVRTISYGKERPVAMCADISCWSQNRRAVTALGRQAGS